MLTSHIFTSVFLCTAAAVAIEMNMKKNASVVSIDTMNYLTSSVSGHFDIVLFGDMFYDPDFSSLISDWMKTLPQNTAVLIGDPGRISFMNHPIKRALQCVAKYDLPMTCRLENNGLTNACVWKYNIMK